MKNINHELNEATLRNLFETLEARRGKDYALGFVFSVMLEFLDENPKLRHKVERHLVYLNNLNKVA
ncbi:hypothetical protein EBT25_14860 [bacterium]|nr:hypothetical protein [bacterium]